MVNVEIAQIKCGIVWKLLRPLTFARWGPFLLLVHPASWFSDWQVIFRYEPQLYLKLYINAIYHSD